jgi:hypothetical protein
MTIGALLEFVLPPQRRNQLPINRQRLLNHNPFVKFIHRKK